MFAPAPCPGSTPLLLKGLPGSSVALQSGGVRLSSVMSPCIRYVPFSGNVMLSSSMRARSNDPGTPCLKTVPLSRLPRVSVSDRRKVLRRYCRAGPVLHWQYPAGLRYAMRGDLRWIAMLLQPPHLVFSRMQEGKGPAVQGVLIHAFISHTTRDLEDGKERTCHEDRR